MNGFTFLGGNIDFYCIMQAYRFQLTSIALISFIAVVITIMMPTRGRKNDLTDSCYSIMEQAPVQNALRASTKEIKKRSARVVRVAYFPSESAQRTGSGCGHYMAIMPDGHRVDVTADGSCGFRSLALILGMDEDRYCTVRKRIANELLEHSENYGIEIEGLRLAVPHWDGSDEFVTCHDYAMHMLRYPAARDQINEVALHAFAKAYRLRLHVHIYRRNGIGAVKRDNTIVFE